MIFSAYCFIIFHMEYFFWQKPEFPHFIWNPAKLIPLLSNLHNNQGLLDGRMRALGFTVKEAGNMERIASEIIKSAEIEGEKFAAADIRSSVAKKLGLTNIVLSDYTPHAIESKKAGSINSANKKVDAVVELVVDAINNCYAPLTEQRLFAWHTMLFPEGRSGVFHITTGAYRTDENGPMRVISGSMGREKIHYEAPPAKDIAAYMRSFLKWFNTSDLELHLDSVLKSAVSHLYFVSLHPFDDGNGRIARAVADMALCRGDDFNEKDVLCAKSPGIPFGYTVRSDHLFSMSAQLCKEKKEYYYQLENTQRGNLDITEWLVWYIGCMNRAVKSVLAELDCVQKRQSFWNKANQFFLNERQKKMLCCLTSNFEGNLTSTKWASLCKCSQDTASRDISVLLQNKILVKGNSGGRSTFFLLNEKLFEQD